MRGSRGENGRSSSSSGRNWLWTLACVAALVGALSIALTYVMSRALSTALGGTAEEVLRVVSPDSSLDAVVQWSSGGGAAGYSDLFVYIVPRGEPPRGPVLLWTDHPVPEIRWLGTSQLELRPGSFVRSFRNFWTSGQRADTVEIRLSPPLHTPKERF